MSTALHTYWWPMMSFCVDAVLVQCYTTLLCLPFISLSGLPRLFVPATTPNRIDFFSLHHAFDTCARSTASLQSGSERRQLLSNAIFFTSISVIFLALSYKPLCILITTNNVQFLSYKFHDIFALSLNWTSVNLFINHLTHYHSFLKYKLAAHNSPTVFTVW